MSVNLTYTHGQTVYRVHRGRMLPRMIKALFLLCPSTGQPQILESEGHRYNEAQLILPDTPTFLGSETAAVAHAYAELKDEFEFAAGLLKALVKDE